MTNFTLFIHLQNLNRPCESIMLDLRFKIKLPDNVQGIISLLPSLTLQGLTIENHRHLTTETQDDFIKVDILNMNFNNTASIKKNQEIGRLTLLPQDNDESIVTSYKTLQ